GDEVSIFPADNAGNLTGFSHGVAFRASQNGVSFGRWINSQGDESFPAIAALTLGAVNSEPAHPAVLINEIMYHPLTGGVEFIELWNLSGSALPLFDPEHPENTWSINGVDFDFPQSQTLGPDELALIVAGDPAAFRAANGLSAGVKIYGPFLGSLDNAGERVSVRRPDGPAVDGSGATVVPMIDVDSVAFADAAPWPTSSDGSGPSLERINFAAYSDDAVNWSASAEHGGTPGVLRGLLPLSLSADGQGTVTASPSQSNFLEGSVVVLTPIPAAGWEFVNWTGDASGTAVPLSITMTAAKSITAVFRERFELSTNVTGAGTIAVTPQSPDYRSGQSVTVQAEPGSGYRFAGWSGALGGATNPASVTMNSDKSITATFVRQLAVGILTGNGGSVSVSPDQSFYDEGSTVTLTAVAANGFVFSTWGGDASGAANPLGVVVTQDLEISATFSAVATLATSVNGGGTIQQSPAGTQFVLGTGLSLTAVAQPGWAFTGWTGALAGTTLSQSLVLNTNATVTANFARVFNVTSSVPAGGGTISISPPGTSFIDGTAITLTATPEAGYRFDQWGGNLAGVTDNPASRTLTSDISATATFVKQWTLTIGQADGGSAAASPEASLYGAGIRVMVTATPEAGYLFTGWNGDSPGPANPATIIMDSNKVLNPVFVRGFALRLDTEGDGSVNASPVEELYPTGTSVTLTAVPGQASAFAGWSGDASGSSNPLVVSMTSDKAINAEFRSAATPFDEWLAGHFTPKEIQAGVLTLTTADADADGFANVIEFGAGTNPRSASDGPMISVLGSTDGLLTVTIDRPAGITGVRWIMEVAGDVQTWNYNGDGTGQTYAQDVETSALGAGMERLTFRSVQANGLSRYVRLRAVLLED
ncbi:MAG: hypothetical protein O3A87_03840, partial [Verrucomicrobia bacterium]|nr:hypothetical protein [Verrucomicrobiota bacterium]